MGKRGAKAEPVADRIARNIAIDAETGCHVWTGALAAHGYARIVLPAPRRSKPVHRLTYEAAKGPIPEGMVIDHLCRNRACCNPDHLEAVTQLENVRRGVGVGFQNDKKTHCPQGHPYDELNTEIDGSGFRHCRECRRDSSHRYRQRRKIKND